MTKYIKAKLAYFQDTLGPLEAALIGFFALFAIGMLIYGLVS